MLNHKTKVTVVFSKRYACDWCKNPIFKKMWQVGGLWGDGRIYTIYFF